MIYNYICQYYLFPFSISCLTLSLHILSVEYDEVFASDLVHYIRTMYNTMDKQGHLQVLKYRTNVDNLNQLQVSMKEQFEQNKENKKSNCDVESMSKEHYEEERAKELYEQVVRNRVLGIETLMIERAYPYLPDCDGSLSSRITFMQAIQSNLYTHIYRLRTLSHMELYFCGVFKKLCCPSPHSCCLFSLSHLTLLSVSFFSSHLTLLSSLTSLFSLCLTLLSVSLSIAGGSWF